MYEMISSRIKYNLLGCVGKSLGGKGVKKKGQEETFEPPYLLKKKALAEVRYL